MLILLAVAAVASQSAATPQTTDFGIREVRSQSAQPAAAPTVSYRPLSDRVDLKAAAALGAGWGRVTSTWRSPQRNRAVGGVRNSFHLFGRAIDIARRAGVRHRDIEAAYRRAGFTLLESLDEGDHSHFAFGTAQPGGQLIVQASAGPAAAATGETRWHIVTAPELASR